MGNRRTESGEQAVRRNEETGSLADCIHGLEYALAHDLRAPLRSITGFSSALLEEYGGCLDPVGRDYLERIAQASRRMNDLIEGMLLLFDAGGRRELLPTEVDLSALAWDIIAQLPPGNRTGSIEWAVQPGMTARGEAALLRSVMENLIGNAWKFTAKQPRARIEIGAIPRDGSSRVFFVRDNGIGFDPRLAGRLFKPFGRAHSEQDFPGLGIGLALVHGIIARHRGCVWAEGEKGRGATFYFTVALDPPACDAAPR